MQKDFREGAQIVYDTGRIMRRETPQIELLNASNHLLAHKVSPKIKPGLIEASLRHTTSLFPHEPTAADGLRRAYGAIIDGSSMYDGCELLEYSIYTTEKNQHESVVGAAGIYRVIEKDIETDRLLCTLRSSPPGSVSFLRNHRYSIDQFLWGGRLSIEPSGARSFHIMPFIMTHILSRAVSIATQEGWPPVLLAFTLRKNNDGVQAFYRNLGFEKTGCEISFAGEVQDVLALHLGPGMTALGRLQRISQRVANRLPT